MRILAYLSYDTPRLLFCFTEVFVLWVQWYMILVYCVVGVVILAVLVGVIWYFCASHQELCVQVTKREVVKTKVKREVIEAQLQPPTAQKLDIGKCTNNKCTL